MQTGAFCRAQACKIERFEGTNTEKLLWDATNERRTSESAMGEVIQRGLGDGRDRPRPPKMKLPRTSTEPFGKT